MALGPFVGRLFFVYRVNRGGQKRGRRLVVNIGLIVLKEEPGVIAARENLDYIFAGQVLNQSKAPPHFKVSQAKLSVLAQARCVNIIRLNEDKSVIPPTCDLDDLLVGDVVNHLRNADVFGGFVSSLPELIASASEQPTTCVQEDSVMATTCDLGDSFV